MKKCNLRGEDAHIVQDPVLIVLGIAHSRVDNVLDLGSALSRATHHRRLHRFVEVGASQRASRALLLGHISRVLSKLAHCTVNLVMNG